MKDLNAKLAKLWIIINKAYKEGIYPENVKISRIKGSEDAFTIKLGSLSRDFYSYSNYANVPSEEKLGFKVNKDFLEFIPSNIYNHRETTFFIKGEKNYHAFKDEDYLFDYRYKDELTQYAKNYNEKIFGLIKSNKPTFEEVKYSSEVNKLIYYIRFGSIREEYSQEEFEEIYKHIENNDNSIDQGIIDTLFVIFEKKH